MSKFDKALQWLMEGKKVRRKDWIKDNYIHIMRGNLVNCFDIPVNAEWNEILYDDWEILKPSQKTGDSK